MSEQPAPTPDPLNDNQFLKYMIRNPEAFSANVAKMIEEGGRALAAYFGPREKGELKEELSEELTHVVKTFAKVGEYWMSDPARSVEVQSKLISSYMGIWNNAMRRAMGEEVDDQVAPTKDDRRFKDPEWSDNQFFDFLKQIYLVTSTWAEDLVEDAEELDDHTRHKARFYMNQINSALAPTNFLLTNPELLRTTLESDGENLVRGMKMLAEDIADGEGNLRIRQSDPTKFAVGENLATTPGKVVHQTAVCQVLMYEPSTPTVLKRPLLIIPPWINKFYILDLKPEKSFIKWCVDQGQTVFVISWVNPDERQAEKSFVHYMKEGIFEALTAVAAITGEEQVNAVGYCVGGTLLAVTLAYMAKMKDHRIASATLFTTQVDFTHAGDLKVFVDEEQLETLERRMREKGYLDGRQMSSAFNMLRSNDLIWAYVVNNYMLGKEPFPFDLLYWNSDSTRMPAANHSFYLRNCYLNNRLAKGDMEIAGETLSLSDCTIPIFNLATREDHIAPPKSVFYGSRLFGGDVTFCLTGSGHIAGVINPPQRNKYQFWTGGKAHGDLESWLAKATETPGSWWPLWDKWIRSHDDAAVKARKPRSRGKFKAIEEAPGSYVKARA